MLLNALMRYYLISNCNYFALSNVGQEDTVTLEFHNWITWCCHMTENLGFVAPFWNLVVFLDINMITLPVTAS
jgi:hypothetical protein